jgi:hypothetical protein
LSKMLKPTAMWALAYLIAMDTAPTLAYTTRSSAYDSEKLFTFPWKCRDPTNTEILSITAQAIQSSDISSEYDPIGVSGGCMPDATCVDGRSQWTNVFGYATISDSPFLVSRARYQTLVLPDSKITLALHTIIAAISSKPASLVRQKISVFKSRLMVTRRICFLQPCRLVLVGSLSSV